MPLDDLTDLFDPDLVLPIGGKAYRVPPPSAVVGLRLQALQALAVARARGEKLGAADRARLRMDDGAEVDLHRDALGPVYDELLADGVNIEYLRHAGTTAYLRWAVGRDRAEEFWRSRAGEASRPLSTTAAAPATTGGGEATTTPSPASGSGTRSRRKSSPAGSARKAPARSGTTS